MKRLEILMLLAAGFTLRAGDTVIAHDPYLSRPGLLATLFRSYQPDASILDRAELRSAAVAAGVAFEIRRPKLFEAITIAPGAA